MDEFLIYGEPIKGWTLIRAMKDVANMKAGEWGLAYTTLFFSEKNFQPSFVFSDIPNDMESDDFELYIKTIEDFEECMKVDPQVGYAFYESCLLDQFDPISEDFYIFVASRVLQVAINGQKQLSEAQMKILMEIFVAREDYEKAALVRDTLDHKRVGKVF